MPSQIKECGYCPNPATTVDHVIPRNLFVSPLPNNMITVPCCGACNGLKSTSDQFLRDALVCYEDFAPHAIADENRDKYKRAKATNRSELWKMINANRFPTLNVSHGGTLLGTVLSMPVGNGPFRDAIIWVIKGLYYKMEGKRLPKSRTILTGMIGGPDVFAKTLRDCQQKGHVSGGCLGSDVFCFFSQSYIDDDGGFLQYYGLAFYNRFYLSAMTVKSPALNRLSPTILKQFGGMG